MKLSPIAAAILASTLLAGCSQPAQDTQTSQTEAPQEAAAPVADAKAEIGEWGLDLTAMDKATSPGTDFNRYVNGNWLDTYEIPADKSRFGIFTELRDRSTAQVKDIIEDLSASDAAPGSLEQKVGAFYKSWMNTSALNDLAATPLDQHIGSIQAIEDKAGLITAMSTVHATSPFGFGIIPDPADTTRYAMFASQAGLGLPDRDYYLKDEERFANYRNAYRSYIVNLLNLASISDAAIKADKIIALEKQLAEVHWTRAESRDIQKIYNPMSPEQLAELAPEFDWKGALANLGLSEMDTIVVAQPSALQASAKIFADTPVQDWKDYLIFHFINDHATYLSQDFDNARFDFYSKTLRGVEAQRDRWKRGSDLVNGNLGEAVGKIYVDRHFPMEAKTKMDELVQNLKDAFKVRIEQNQWMDEETKQQALVKLSTFEPRIGFTEKWTDYSALEIVEGDMLGNMMRVAEFNWKQQVERLGGAVDRDLWPYPPQTVNASYNPLMNQITFPAGILQPPFFDMNADPAINYGAIGGVIGHEIGHGFDDQGRRFDEKGKIRDWWTAASNDNFKLRSDKLVAQYNNFSPIEGMNVNGELTLGENIGDLGGLEMAYSAYKLYVEKHGEPQVIDGFTGEQRFFMSWAQVWRGKMREDGLRQQLLTDPHSPMQYRVNGVVRNIDAWYDAFGVKEGDAMYLAPEERVSIW